MIVNTLNYALMKDEANGYIINANDSKTVRDKIEFLLKEPKKINYLGNQIDISNVNTVYQKAVKLQQIYNELKAN